ncbi:ribbon-helix-helix protein, CopG family [Sphingomonas sp. MG17]|uniref:Ribbon-helix-helix protein, CopG family n=1 Tax=Sphingomonas tagetis TaxID=2949092 RepID=A0A9X2KMQ5_9SPHN|nr:ribbon-helix-helix protein, CopG family [Sphingomonas tagetis]
MDSTRRLSVELPEDIADAVEARVSTGEYASVSAVIEDGLRALAERDDELLRDPAVEKWLREEVVPEAQRVREGKARLYSPEEVQTRLDALHARTLRGE